VAGNCSGTRTRRRKVSLTCLEGWLRGEVFDLVREVRRLRAEVEFLTERLLEEAR